MGVNTYQELSVSGYDFEYVEDLKIVSEINHHAKLIVTGVVSQKNGKSYMTSSSKNKKVKVSLKNTVIFYGIVMEEKTSVKKGVYTTKIKAYSLSMLMDIKKKSRSFQNTGMTSGQIVKKIASDYDADMNVHVGDSSINELLVQYEETDWEFVKRVISKYKEGLFPRYHAESIKIDAGTPDREKKLEEDSIHLPEQTYEAAVDLKEYKYMKENFVSDASKADFLTYTINTSQVLYMGDTITFLGQKLMILQAEYEMKNGILTNRFKLRPKAGLKQIKLYNEKIIGCAIQGKIASVSGEKVKVNLEIDNDDGSSGNYLFKFSTMSASEDGSGWYCMPEVGDNVRVYFPDHDEDEAFAVSAVSGYIQGASESEDRMGNPDNKYLRTPSDKQISLKPDGIYVSCNSGQADMTLKTDGTIVISSAQSISLTAQEDITIDTQANFNIAAAQTVDIVSDLSGELILDQEGNIKERGMQVNNNRED